MLQCVAVYCSVLQCDVVCCNVLQCIAACCFTSAPRQARRIVVVVFAVYCSVFQRVAVLQQKHMCLHEYVYICVYIHIYIPLTEEFWIKIIYNYKDS